ncbi:hypothetical protein ACH40G_33920 [Streptomyces rubiginosohelvolus]|uniref:hypothetical protein n=1 Tax=Streptomyces rubiginosohelvolus TaxID=67362 RepID=UPI0037A3B403
MTMQQDGNLVVHNEQNKPIWAAMTFGENHRAIFQPDGNLVIHNGDDRAIRASKTHDFGGAQMVLRPDAEVVIVHRGKVVCQGRPVRRSVPRQEEREESLTGRPVPFLSARLLGGHRPRPLRSESQHLVEGRQPDRPADESDFSLVHTS